MFKTLALVSVAVVLCQVLGSLRSFILAKMIVPSDYGIWTGLQVIISLAPIACLGTVEALVKQVSFFRGNGDRTSRNAVEGSVFASVIFAALILVVISIVSPGWLQFVSVGQNSSLVQLTLATAAISFISAFYYHRTLAVEDFHLLSLFDFSRSLLGLLGVVVGGKYASLSGAVLGLFLAEALTWVLFSTLCSRAHGRVVPVFSPRLMLSGVRVGMPITVIWWVYGLQASIGRIISLSYLSTEVTGYLGVATSLTTLLALIPNMVGRVFYPAINAQVGAGTGVTKLRLSVVGPASVLALILPPLQLILYLAIPYVYRHVLVKYENGVLCSQILTLGAFFACVLRNGVNYMIATNAQTRLLKYVLVSLGSTILGCLAAVKCGLGINGIAVAIGVSGFILSTSVWVYVFKSLEYTSTERMSLFMDLYGPFLLMVLILVAVQTFFSALRLHSAAGEYAENLVAICTLAFVGWFMPSVRSRVIQLSQTLFKQLRGREQTV